MAEHLAMNWVASLDNLRVDPTEQTLAAYLDDWTVGPKADYLAL